MAIYWDRTRKKEVSFSPNKVEGNANYVLLRQKSTVVHELPDVETKYIKEDINGFPVEMTEQEKAQADIYELDKIKDSYEYETKLQCAKDIEAGFLFEGYRYQCEEKDISNYQSMLMKTELLGEYVEITLHDKSYKVFEVAKLGALTDAAFIHKATQLQLCKNKIKIIRACESKEELESL